MESSEAYSMEMAALEKAVDTGKTVKLFFVTGYQAEVVIESFDMEVIVCRPTKNRKQWLVYRDKLCTIEV